MRPGTLSVSELNEYVRRSLAGDPMLQGIAILGEISNFKRHTSGHLYFTMKDEASRISCVMFRQHAQMLRFQPEDGMRVRLSGAVGLYSATGSYQFYGEAMAAEGAGALYELFLKTRERLQKEGLFDASLKKPLPLLPGGIGIVTSGGGAVLHDILTVTRRRFQGMPLYLRAAQVQGSGAADDLARALNEIAQLPQVEVIIIGRGGGSLEDLWAFNEEVLVRAVAACAKPVISAVGHETDVTLTDFAADVRAPTPSAAAELEVPERAELLARVERLEDQLFAAANQRLEQAYTRLQTLALRLEQHNPASQLKLFGLRLAALAGRLRTSAETQFHHLVTKTQSVVQRFELSGPGQTLRRGYVIALDHGKPVLSVEQVKEELTLQFHDGRAYVKTISVKKEEAR